MSSTIPSFLSTSSSPSTLQDRGAFSSQIFWVKQSYSLSPNLVGTDHKQKRKRVGSALSFLSPLPPSLLPAFLEPPRTHRFQDSFQIFLVSFTLALPLGLLGLLLGDLLLLGCLLRRFGSSLLLGFRQDLFFPVRKNDKNKAATMSANDLDFSDVREEALEKGLTLVASWVGRKEEGRR